MYTMRKATGSDSSAIRRLIWKVHINPTGLDWRHFLLAVDQHGRLVGTGQIKPHKDGTFELASIAVEPTWRRHGVAGAIIHALLADSERPHPLYLTCRDRLGPFYERFGFRTLSPGEMPPELGRNAARLTWLKNHLFHNMPGLLVMAID